MTKDELRALPYLFDFWALSMRLRGQQSTDAITPGLWAVGSTFTLLDGAVQALEPGPGSNEGSVHYRISLENKPVDHESYVTNDYQSVGLSLLPFLPAHLTAEVLATGDLAVSWIRKSHIYGDS